MTLLRLLAVLGLLWAGGLWHFQKQVATATAPQPQAESADAIIVLTGGPQRLGEGLRLLDAKVASKLFLSGVHAETSKAMLPGHAEQTALFDCCVELGHLATDTEGNALEAQAWAARNGFNKLVLVTASWHMPRAMVEFARRLPTDVVVVPHPVVVAPPQARPWPATLVLEYGKYVAALIRARLGTWAD
jgi:uncharacterized SAM-binding protein YcdF (DUF218 family)